MTITIAGLLLCFIVEVAAALTLGVIGMHRFFSASENLYTWHNLWPSIASCLIASLLVRPTVRALVIHWPAHRKGM